MAAAFRRAARSVGRARRRARCWYHLVLPTLSRAHPRYRCSNRQRQGCCLQTRCLRSRRERCALLPSGSTTARSRHDTAQMLVGRDMVREAMMTLSDRNAVSIASSSLRDLGIEAGSSRLSVYMPASAARMRALCELARGEAVAPGCEIVFSEAWR